MQIIVTIDGTQPKEAAKAGAFWLEYQKHCGKCGKCGSENTLFTHRKQQGFDFYEAACADCGARYSFGQKREDGSLFPKRDKGWEKFQKQESSGGYVGDSNTGGDSSDPHFSQLERGSDCCRAHHNQPMKQMKLPPPGSDAAIAMSCSCPVLDNSHGHGYMGQQGIYVFSGNCPLHVIGTQVDITADPNDDDELNVPLGTAACNLDGECESCQ